MNLQDIRNKARALGIKVGKLNKTDLVRAIQRSEDNIECYATDRIEHCGELGCLWRSDCAEQKKEDRLQHPNMHKEKEKA